MSLRVDPTIFSGFDTCKLSGVHVSEKRLGHGSYASVFELEYKGQKCAGKKIHEILLEQGDTSYTVRRFEEECRLLSMLSHANIVQFLGVYFEEEQRVPMLVMEFLPTNLTSCIEQHGILPLDTSIPILHDVALGLCYLHSRTPPIIHRDLSSNNVLLTNSMVAKISDLGVARMLNLSPLQISRMTETPGTPAYMPPEVMIANPRYDTSIDEFSYGIMMIHVFCGKWPEPQCGQIEMEEGTGRLIPVTEAQRRQNFLEDIGNDHPLTQLILKCVQNDPMQRPRASEIESTVLHCLLNLPVDFNMVDDTMHLLDVLNKTRFLSDLLNKQDDRGYTLLHIAAERNCLESLKCLLIKKANPNVRSIDVSKNVTPLHIAAGLGHLACLQLLVQQGGNILATDAKQLTPMEYARKNGKDLCLSYLNDVLAKKVREECVEMLRVLAEVEQNLSESMDHWKICDSLFPSTIAKSQLSVAENIKYRRCTLYNDPELVRIFNQLTRPGCIPHLLHGANFLHAACRCGKLSLVQHLLDRMPAFTFSRTSEGYSALHIAVAHKQLDIVKALTQQQVTSLTWVHNHHVHTVSSSHNNLEDSSSHGVAKFGSSTMSGHTAIHLAVAVNDTSILNYLLKHHRELRLSLDASKCNYTALHLAVYLNRTDAVQLLLRRGANPNTWLDPSQLEKVTISRTPLSEATTNKNLQMLSLLLEGGAEDKHYDALRTCVLSHHHHEFMAPLLGSLVKHDRNYKPTKNARDQCHMMAMIKWSGLQLTELQPDWIAGALHQAQFLCSQNIDSSRVTEFITCFNLSNNHLKTLPQEVFFLPKLQQLIVSNNELESLPEIQKVWIQSEGDYVWPCFSLNRILLDKNHLVLLPDFIFHIPKLSFLDVSQNHLRKIPFSMWTAPKLHTFLCNHNEIREIPTNWPHVMNECNIIHMSVSLKSIESSLKSRLNSMEIFGTPDNDGRSKKSFSHDIIGSNEIENRTEAIKLTILQDRLNISNGLLPIEWQSSDSQDEEYEGLVLLELSNNHISEIPENLPCLCPKLIRLELDHNKIKTICFPRSFPSTLKHLNMSHNPLKSLDCPQMMAKPLPCTNPDVLQKSGFTIHINEVSFCAHRTHLTLPELAVLKISRCSLEDVNFFRLQAVVQHGESGNDQVDNNATIGSSVTTFGSNTWPQDRKHPNGSKLVFPFLTQLDLSYNQLESVPESICEMTELNTLNLSYNAITSLPVEMGKLHKLCELPLYGLRLVYPPYSITNNGKTKDIIGYLCSLFQGAHPYHQMKLMLVGYAARGKTTLLQKITEKGKRGIQENWSLRKIIEGNRYNKDERFTISTVGILVSDWTYYKQVKQSQSGLKSITFKTWDFSGQEEYYATYQYFLSHRSLYLVVWKVTHGMKGALEIKPWLLDIQARAPHSPVVIVGTHEDKLNSRLRRELEQAKDYINRTYGTLEKRKEGFPQVMYSTVVSCKSGYHIKDLRDKIFDIASQLKESIVTGWGIGRRHSPEQCRLMDQPVPAFYLQLERTVQNIAMSMKSQRKPPFLTYSELREAVLTADHQAQISCDDLDLKLKSAISFLHDIGTMLHYEDPLLSNLYFVDPQWLCDMLAHIINVREINPLVRDGVMRISDFPLIFNDEEFPIQWQKEYIRLLTRFEVAVELGNGELLIPPALNPDKPNLSQTMLPENLNFLPPLRHCYVVPFIPSGFWPRLISRLLTDSTIIWLAREGCGLIEDDQLTWVKWRTGMILQYGNLTILSVEELNGGMFPKAQSCDGVKIYGEDKWRIHHSDYSIFGINIEVPDIYPILKYPEAGVKTKIGNEQLNKFITAESGLVHNSSMNTQRNQQPSSAASPMLSSFIDEEKNDIMRAGLLSKVVDHITLLVEDWFVGVRPRTSVIPCPFCSEDTPRDVAQFRRSFSNNPMLLSSKERMERGLPADSEQQQTAQPSPQGNPPSTEAASTAVFSMDQNLGNTKSVPTSLSTTRSNQHSQQDHLGDMMSERTHARTQTSPRTSRQHSRRYCYAFKHHECIVTAHTQDTMQCPTHGDILLTYMAPDTMFMTEGHHILVEPDKLKRGENIGKGAFVTVYKAKMKKTSEEGEEEIDVAFKALTKEWRLQEADPDYSLEDPIDSDTRSLFSRNGGITRRSIIDGFGSVKKELSILSPLKHPHIIQLHGVMMRPLGLILELAPLGSLKNILHEYAEAHAHLHISVTKQVVIQIASALQYLHDNKIIYRDLKSDNVLVWNFPDPQDPIPVYGAKNVLVKLSDYGISQFVATQGARGLVGTPGFMAPEMLKYQGKEVYNCQIDVFSFAMFMYELITLHVSYVDLNAQQANQANEKGERPSLKRKDFPCPVLLRELMVWCWQENPDDRPTANDILQKISSTCIEFSKLIDGIRLCDMGQVTCAPVVTIHDSTPSSQKAHKMSKKPTFNEIWVVCGDVHHSIASITHYSGQFINIEDLEVGNSPVLCMCEIQDKMWMGCENGQLMVFATSTKRLLLQTWTKENKKVLSMVHVASLCKVYLGLDDGSVLMYNDELPPGLSAETPANVKLDPLMEYLDVKQVSSSLLVIEKIETVTVKTDAYKYLHILTDSQLSDQATVQQPTRITTHELWVGQTSGFVTVLNAETLTVITYIYNPFETSRLPSYVAFLVTNHPHNIYYNDSESRETCENFDTVNAPQKDLLTVYGAVYDGQFVTSWDAEKKRAVESYNCEKHLEEGEECNITALHYSQLQLYVGLKSGKILIMNALTFNLIHCLDFHRGTVNSILSLSQINSANKDFSPEPETSDSEAVPFHSRVSDSHNSQLLTIGVGFKSYFDGVEAQAKLNSSFMLVWEADNWTRA